ncbi:MAG: shikimate dehydrogenase [Prochlorococcaceae cyanobacterium]
MHQEPPLFRPLSISGATALVAVLGDPVRHSLSPAMHNAALAALGLDWVYLALPTPAEQLAGVLTALEAIDCRGLNVTLPHKQAAAELAAACSPLAERLGAVNTLVRRAEGGWLGSNTDVAGFLAPLTSQGRPWQGQQAVLLGCGGSARAVVAGLAELGLTRISVAARRPEPLAAFLEHCSPWAPQLQALAWEALPAALAQADLLVNTTPVGMASAADPSAQQACPLGAEALAALKPGSTVYDLIYTPRPTTLLRLASERQCQTLDGLEMLVQQGAAALRLWSGIEDLPIAAMRDAALAQLLA